MPAEDLHCSLMEKMETGDSAAGEPSAACMLTEDAIVLIVKLLPFRDRIQARKVCRAWQIAVDRTWSSTKKLDFKTETWSSDNSMLTVSLISEVIERCGRFLDDVDFRKFTIRIVGDGMRSEDAFDIDEDYEGFMNALLLGSGNKYLPRNKIIPSLIKHCSNLTRLAVYNVQPEDMDLKDLYMKNQGLKSLSVVDCGTGESLLSLPQCLERLEIIKETLSLDIFSGLISLCPVIKRLVNLKHVKISRDEFVTPDEIECLQSLKYLESYALIQCGIITYIHRMFGGDPPPPPPYYLRNVPEYANLRSLTLDGQPSCTDTYLKSVAERCNMVETISLSCSDYVSDSGLSSLLNLGSVKHLSIYGLTNVTANFLNSAHNLVELNCGECRGIDENGLYTFITCSETLLAVYIRGCFILTEEWKLKFEQLSEEKEYENLKITVEWAEE